jgi:hypothetical protein
MLQITTLKQNHSSYYFVYRFLSLSHIFVHISLHPLQNPFSCKDLILPSSTIFSASLLSFHWES